MLLNDTVVSDPPFVLQSVVDSTVRWGKPPRQHKVKVKDFVVLPCNYTRRGGAVWVFDVALLSFSKTAPSGTSTEVDLLEFGIGVQFPEHPIEEQKCQDR